MTEQPLLINVLEATGYLANGEPAAPGVHLGEAARGKCRTREFSPDAMWRSDSELTVYFKEEQTTPPDDRVAAWHQEIWNLGSAPLLWVVSPEQVDIYNGFGRPTKAGDATEHRLRTFRRVESELNKLDAFAGRFAMETGQFWNHEKKVNRKTSVDRQLLSDLAAVEHDLIKTMDRSAAQALIGRSIFTQYLIDRRIVTTNFLQLEFGHGTLAGVLRSHSKTKKLFEWLQQTFNGDMFPPIDSSSQTPEHLRRVADFLEAMDPETGQGTLFPYLFDMIPVELISRIYEQFAHSNPSSDDIWPGQDVHYTKPSLVSLVLDETMEGLTGKEVVLDMACGSGVFLIEALRKLVALRSGSERPRRDVIRSTLHQQIYGVDISEAAIRVAAFSLYLAALELDPDPQPPEALRFERLIGKTLVVGDAWQVERTPEGEVCLIEHGRPKIFDVIVGNPPWRYGGRSSRAERRSQGDRLLFPRGDSLDFVARVMDFASDKTRFGLVLSGVQFFSRSGTGEAALRNIIEKLAPVTLVNLSYHLQWLFPHSKLPAMVLIAKRLPSARAAITAVQVPWSPAGRQTHTFELSHDDIVALPLADWQRRPELLKASFFGLSRDLALLERLIIKHASLRERLEEFGTKLRSGFKIGNRSRDAKFLFGLPLLNNNDLRPLSIPDSLAPYGIERAEWPRGREVYRAPLLLVREFLWMQDEGRLATAVSERDVVFKDAYFGAALPARQIRSGYLLAGVLSSSLASWFVLMTGSSFGVHVQRMLLRDIEQLPVPDLEIASRSEAGRRLTQLVKKLHRRPPNGDDWQALDEAVFDLYGLSDADRVIACDGLFRAEWQWSSGRLESVAAAAAGPHILAYAKAFIAAIDVWLSAANRRRMRAEVLDLPLSVPLRVVRFVLEKHPGPSVAEVVKPYGELPVILRSIGERLELPLGSSVAGKRVLRAYGPDEVVVIKPAARRHWMGVSALEDADAVIAESLSGRAA